MQKPHTFLRQLYKLKDAINVDETWDKYAQDNFKSDESVSDGAISGFCVENVQIVHFHAKVYFCRGCESRFF